jgi:hypothetical protein
MCALLNLIYRHCCRACLREARRMSQGGSTIAIW